MGKNPIGTGLVTDASLLLLTINPTLGLCNHFVHQYTLSKRLQSLLLNCAYLLTSNISIYTNYYPIYITYSWIGYSGHLLKVALQ